MSRSHGFATAFGAAAFKAAAVRVAGLRVAGFRVAGLRVAGFRVAGFRVAGLRVAGLRAGRPRYGRLRAATLRAATFGAAALGTAALAGPALAEPPYPTVDFQGEWVLSDGKGAEFKARMRYSAAARKMRFDMTEAGVTMASVRDMESGETVMWARTIPGMAMRLPTLKDDDIVVLRTGETRTLGEETCVVWTFKQVQACLTDDNIPLETSARGFTATLTKLARRSQDEAHFEVPAGLTIMNLPSSLADVDMLKLGAGLPF